MHAVSPPRGSELPLCLYCIESVAVNTLRTALGDEGSRVYLLNHAQDLDAFGLVYDGISTLISWWL